MFVFAFLDWKWFKFYPLEAGIFIDVSGRNKDDLALFQQLQNYIRLQDTKFSVYEVFY